MHTDKEKSTSMSARKFSTALGLLLLISSVVGIFIILYACKSNPSTSTNRRIEETLTVRTKWESKNRPSNSESIGLESASDTQVDKGASNMLERILSGSNQRRRDSVGSRERGSWMAENATRATTASTQGTTSTTTTTATELDRRRSDGGRTKDNPKAVQTTPSFVHQAGDGESIETTTQMSWNEFSPSPLSPWAESKVNLRGQLNRRILSPGESQKMEMVGLNQPDNNFLPSRRQPQLQRFEAGASRLPPPKPNSHSLGISYGSFEGGPENSQEDNNNGEDEEEAGILDAEQYMDPDSGLEEEEEDSEQQGIDVGDLFDLATNLYASGTNTTDLQGFLKVLNETVNKGNNTDLLSHLNELYTRPQSTPSEFPQGAVGRNAYETSLTAFVFMSFGVFLLNQIHNFIDKEGTGRKQQGRNYHMNLLHDGGTDEEQDSHLDILFKPPPVNWTKGGQEQLTKFYTDEDRIEMGSDNSSSSSSSSNGFINSGYVNNMFRALLNLINAYTKNSQVLECIWSLYCQDLDQTAGKQGLYGIAARINSIGLRLIMDQIPAELTLDVMLRSLLGWDGLPCTKMFPKCQQDNAALTLQTATSGNSPSP